MLPQTQFKLLEGQPDLTTTISGISGQRSPFAYYIELLGASGYLQYEMGLLSGFVIGQSGVTFGVLQSASGYLQGQINSINTISGSFTGIFASIPFVTGISGYLQSELNYDRSVIALVTGTSGNWATIPYVTGASGYLQGEINTLQSTINNVQFNLNLASGTLQTQINSLNSLSGSWATTGYVTGASGVLQSEINTANVNLTNLNNLSGHWATTGYVTGVSGILQSEIGLISAAEIVDAANITALQGQSGSWATIVYVTGVSGYLQSEINIVSGLAASGGSAVTFTQLTGASGYLQSEINIVSGVGVANTTAINSLKALSGSWATTGYVTGASGILRTDITAIQAVDTTQNTNLTNLNNLSGVWATIPFVTGVSGYLQSEINIVSGLASLATVPNVSGLSGWLYETGTVSIDWFTRRAFDIGGLGAINWNTRILSGAWGIDTNPTTSGSVVNKFYVDTASGSLQGYINIISGIAVTGGDVTFADLTGASGYLQSEINILSGTYQGLGDANTMLSGGIVAAVVTGIWNNTRTITLPPANSYRAGAGFRFSDPAGGMSYNGVTFVPRSGEQIMRYEDTNYIIPVPSVTLYGGPEATWISDGSGTWSSTVVGTVFGSIVLTDSITPFSGNWFGLQTAARVYGDSLRGQGNNFTLGWTNQSLVWTDAVINVGLTWNSEQTLELTDGTPYLYGGTGGRLMLRDLIITSGGSISGYATTGYVISGIVAASGVLRTEVTALKVATGILQGEINALNGLSGSWATTGYVTGASGYLQSEINLVSGTIVGAQRLIWLSTGDVIVSTTGNTSVVYLGGSYQGIKSPIVPKEVWAVGTTLKFEEDFLYTSTGVTGTNYNSVLNFNNSGISNINIVGLPPSVSGLSFQIETYVLCRQTGVSGWFYTWTDVIPSFDINLATSIDIIPQGTHKVSFDLSADITGDFFVQLSDIQNGGNYVNCYKSVIEQENTKNDFLFNISGVDEAILLAASGYLQSEINIVSGLVGSGGGGGITFAQLTGASGYLQTEITALDNLSGSWLVSSGAFKTAYAIETGNYSLAANDSVIIAISSGKTYTLPNSSGIGGQIYVIKNAGTGIQTLVCFSGQTMFTDSGVTTIALDIGDAIEVISDSANWYLL